MAVHEACDRETAAALREYRSWTANRCRSGANNNSATNASRYGSSRATVEINSLPGASLAATGEISLFSSALLLFYLVHGDR